MRTRSFFNAFLLGAGLLAGCPFFTAGEQVDAPSPSAVRAALASRDSVTRSTSASHSAAKHSGPAPQGAATPDPHSATSPAAAMREAAQPGDVATASHILVSYQGAQRAKAGITRGKDEARERAALALQRGLAGEDFAALAKEFSDGPSGPNGGKLGTFPRGRMVPAFDEAVFSLQADQVYPELVETPFGFHVIYREK